MIKEEDVRSIGLMSYKGHYIKRFNVVLNNGKKYILTGSFGWGLPKCFEMYNISPLGSYHRKTTIELINNIFGFINTGMVEKPKIKVVD